MVAILSWIWNALMGVLAASWELFLEMSPYLLLGFLFGGILHIFISVQKIARHLGGASFWSVLKATLIGIPLPLCSCAVIPTAASIRQSGASKGATLAFLISTPTTGVDSILATYSLLGPVFTLYRIAASFLAGFTAGVGANIFDKEKPEDKNKITNNNCVVCGNPTDDAHTHGFWARTWAMIAYSFGELVGDIGKWLVIGTLIGGAIAYFVPPQIIGMYFKSPILQMLVMLAIGIPLYICATGSLPIAAALVAKGISPGAALVFLIAGPATNAATVTVVAKTLGKRSLAIYLTSIAIVSLGMGFLYNVLFPSGMVFSSSGKIVGLFELPPLVKTISAIILSALILLQFGLWMYRKITRKPHHCSDDACSDNACADHDHHHEEEGEGVALRRAAATSRCEPATHTTRNTNLPLRFYEEIYRRGRPSDRHLRMLVFLRSQLEVKTLRRFFGCFIRGSRGVGLVIRGPRKNPQDFSGAQPVVRIRLKSRSQDFSAMSRPAGWA